MTSAAPDPYSDGGRLPAGEDQGVASHFSAQQVAAAFGVDIVRVEKAMAGELGLLPADRVTSKQAQALAEALLSDQPLDQREAALMRLGAFTPRPDDDWGIGDTRPGEESDRYVADPTIPEDELASRTGSFDPSQPVGD